MAQLSPEQTRQAHALLTELIDASPGERARALAAPGLDPSIREEVEAMLAMAPTELFEEEQLGSLGAALAEAHVTAASQPERIGAYRIVDKLGEGGMGTVFLAEQAAPIERRVALKLIRFGFDDDVVKAHFRLEGGALARMNHDAIARVFEFGVTDAGQPFLAMELVEGERLTRWCDDRMQTIRERVELFVQICRGVHHAHQKGVVHRDLKPSNILVCEHEGIGAPKIIDFGIARIALPGEESDSRGRAGAAAGTPAYMSPEQARGDADQIDLRTDVYALGVILCELLCGALPHEDAPADRAAAGSQKRKREATRPSTRVATDSNGAAVARSRGTSGGELRRLLRSDLDWIVMRAVSPDPDQRYESAQALAEDLQRFLAQEVVLARPATMRYRTQRFVARNRALVLASTLAVIALVVATVLSVLSGIQERRARQQADANATRADRSAYRASVSAAAAALRGGDVGLARGFLMDAPIALRGWEWRHLMAELDWSARTQALSVRQPVERMRFTTSLVSADGRQLTLFAGGSYGGGLVQTYDTESLRPSGHWSFTGADGEVLGLVDQGRAIAIRARPTDQVVIRDLVTGAERERRPIEAPSSDSDEGFVFASFSALDSDATLMAMAARRLPVRWRQFGAYDVEGRNWVSWAGPRAATIAVTSPDQKVHLGEAVEGVSRAAFTPDGRHVLVATLDRRLDLYEVASSRHVWGHQEAHDDAITSVAFRSDGLLLATGGQDGVIKLWNVEDGRLRGRLLGHERDVFSLSFDPSGTKLFSSGVETLREWIVEDAIRGSVPVRHGTFVRKLQRGPQNDRLLSLAWRKTAPDVVESELWSLDLATGTTSALALPPGSQVHATAFVADGLVSALIRSIERESLGDLRLCLFDAESGDLVDTHDLAGVAPGAIGGAGGVITIGGRATGIPDPGIVVEDVARRLRHDGSTGRLVWHGDDGHPVHTWKLKNASSYAVDDAGRRGYVGDNSGHLHVFDLASGEKLGQVEVSPEPVMTIAALPDGTRVFCGCKDTTIRVLDAQRLELVAVLRGHKDTVRSLVLADDGATLYSASDDYTVRRWATRPVSARGR